ncbi:hypothetical protein BD626DRAFT_638519 [Schizophyllum amplum]|uniref:Uncharacterized protein n=1 Tax=Schizophyllum amplum TaxID=97359 RepID=A0A550BRR4_9AGAR|nr:hypothetical protein BD626DRAFT_638519 [Auriculariopsis ampla]
MNSILIISAREFSGTSVSAAGCDNEEGGGLLRRRRVAPLRMLRVIWFGGSRSYKELIGRLRLCSDGVRKPPKPREPPRLALARLLRPPAGLLMMMLSTPSTLTAALAAKRSVHAFCLWLSAKTRRWSVLPAGGGGGGGSKGTRVRMRAGAGEGGGGRETVAVADMGTLVRRSVVEFVQRIVESLLSDEQLDMKGAPGGTHLVQKQ